MKPVNGVVNDITINTTTTAYSIRSMNAILLSSSLSQLIVNDIWQSGKPGLDPESQTGITVPVDIHPSRFRSKQSHK